jgi:predicted site-specific integrase-resolvase
MAKTESIVSAHSGFLSLEHAAQWADVPVKTIKRWIERGLPKYQVGKGTKLLIRPRDIETFLTRNECKAPDLNAMVENMCKELGTS